MPAFEIEKHVDKILPFLYKKDGLYLFNVLKLLEKLRPSPASSRTHPC
jgi:hypothetical protein